MNVNSSQILARNAHKYPQHYAVKSETKNMTYAELDEQVNRFSQVLLNKGIKYGDKVIIYMPNIAEFIISYFAVQRIGALVTPINAKLTMPEITFILDHSNASAIICCETLFATAQNIDSDIVKIKTGKQIGEWESFSNLIEESSADVIECDLKEDDLSTLLYTSGTTGNPKGVLFNYRNILTVAQMICIEMEFKPESKILLMMPLSHSAPLHLFMMSGIVVGATLVLRTGFTPQSLIDAVEGERTTHFFGAPVAYLLTAKLLQEKKADLSSMIWWVYGGAPISGEEVQFIKQQFQTDNLVCVYGLTEAGPNGSLLLSEEHDEKTGSIGKRAPLHAELRIINRENNDVATDEVGEILIKGPGNMVGYYRDEASTKEVFVDGWLKTGDLARFDEDGYIWIVDRAKDMIISGGVNVYPLEIENILVNYTDIQEVAVVGLANKEWGETIIAAYVAEKEIDASKLNAFLKRKLASYKISKIYKRIESLPRNATGKVLKYKLRKELG